MAWGAGSPWGAISWGIGSATVTGADGVVSTIGEEELSRLLGEDILFDGDFHETANRDYVVITGLAALKQRILLRMFTMPGAFKTRPGFGVGLLEWVKKPLTTANLDAMRRRIIDQLSLEYAIEEVSEVSVARVDGVQAVRISVSIVTVGVLLRFSPLTVPGEVFSGGR